MSNSPIGAASGPGTPIGTGSSSTPPPGVTVTTGARPPLPGDGVPKAPIPADPAPEQDGGTFVNQDGQTLNDHKAAEQAALNAQINAAILAQQADSLGKKLQHQNFATAYYNIKGQRDAYGTLANRNGNATASAWDTVLYTEMQRILNDAVTAMEQLVPPNN